jgi:hypothetical protein
MIGRCGLPHTTIGSVFVPATTMLQIVLRPLMIIRQSAVECHASLNALKPA